VPKDNNQSIPMATMQRRDTPAARAALARRRQRAAAVVVRPHSNMAAAGFDGSGPLQVDTSGNDKLRVKEVISSPVRSPSNTRPSAAAGGAASPSASKSRSNIPRFKPPSQPPTSSAYSKLKVETVGPPIKQGQNRLSPLAQRAVQSMQKASPSNHTIDGTLTTYTASSASRSFSPVKKAEHNAYSNYYSNPASNSISSENAGQTLKRATDITEMARSAYRASPYQTSSSSSAGPLKKGASISDSGKRLYDGRPGAAATNKRDTSPYNRNQFKRDTNTSPYRNQSPKSKHPPSPKANYLSKENIARSGGAPLPKSNTTTTEGRRTFESKSPGRPRSSFEKRLNEYKKEDLVAATKADANRNEGLLHSQKSTLESSLDPTKAKTASAYNSIQQNHRLENNSSPRRRVEPIGRGAEEDPLSASRRKKAALEAKKQQTATGNSTRASPLYNDTVEQRGSPEEGPLSARRMKMEAADSQQHQPDDNKQQSYSFAPRSSPHQALDTTRRTSPREEYLASKRNNFGEIQTQQPQFNNSSRTSPRQNVTPSRITSESDPNRQKNAASSPPTHLRQSSPQEKSIFESAFSASRMAISPSTPDRAVNQNSESPILRRSISPRRSHRILPPSGRTGFSSPPRPVMHSPEYIGARRQDGFLSDNQEPSPPNRQTTSPRLEARNPPFGMERPRPPPIDTGTFRHETHGTIPTKDLPFHRMGSPQRQENNNRILAPPERSSRYHTTAKAVYQTTVTSPGVQHLTTLLMDSSFATDVSTLAEMQYQRPASPAARKPTQKVSQVPVKHHDELGDELRVDGRNHHLLDSACLESGSFVFLKAYSIGASIKARKREGANDFSVEARGLCLGRDDELFMLTKVVANGTAKNDPLRHGDTVVLHSSLAQKTLGVRKENRGAINSPLELGFFSPDAPPGAQWTVLIARHDKEVLIGRAAVALQHQDSGGTAASLVRSGDPVVLRNNHTGGILSIDTPGSLVMLNDSYNQSTSGDPSLLQRLQHHDRLLPSRNETFQLVSHATPPCPAWISGRDADERIFLTGSYLLQQQRNQRSAEFESNLFVANGQPSILAGRMQWGNIHLSSSLKEKILLDEVIGSFLGLEGKHVRLKAATGRTVCLDDFEFQLFDADGVTFDVGLRNLVDQILPLSTSFVRVQNFVSSHHPGYEYGKVMHAFCEGLDGLLQDYVSFVAQIERQFRQALTKSDTLTMKNVYFQITSSLHSMSILEHVAKAVTEKKGGALLNTLRALDTRVYMGDVVAKKVLTILLEKASAPYMNIMTTWLQSGVLQDPYEEFMISRSHPGGSKPHYNTFDGDAWSGLFIIKEEHVIEVVSPELTKQKVMTTGKYWNAVQACHTDYTQFRPVSDGRHVPALPMKSGSSAISSYIESMYRSASKALVQLLMNDFKLMESLQVMKRYFLLDQGDFLMNFLDAAGAELVKDFEHISIGRVQHWLSMSIQLAESPREDEQGIDLHQEQRESCKLTPSALKCCFRSDSLMAHLDYLSSEVGNARCHYPVSNGGLTGIESFSLDFARVSFPTSLVLSQFTMENYKLLFRHLFFAKHVERRLVGVWRDHQSLKSLHSLRGLLGRTFLLRQRMLHFVQNLLYYMSFEVIESNWTEMLASIDSSNVSGRTPTEKDQTVDDIFEVHNDFLRRTMDACLLTNRQLFQSLTKLMNTCLLFADQMKRFMESTRIVREVGLSVVANSPFVWLTFLSITLAA
jgi:gamma-tubulin complex component 2